MTIELRDFDYLLSSIKEGFSKKQLSYHFQVYQEHVIKLYQLEMGLKKGDTMTVGYPWGVWNELQRCRASAYNGAVLHELYFENLTAEKIEIPTEMKDLIIRDFGSLEAWEEDLWSAALIGQWVLLTYSHPEKKLQQFVIAENHIGMPVEQTILIALDCWEHAWMVDYPGKIEDYLGAFMTHLNWNRANLRLKIALK